MSVRTMSLVFEYDMPDLETDDGRTVPDRTAKFVLLAPADHANDQGEGSYPGVKEAIPVLKKAIRLNPFAPSTIIFNLGLSYLFSGQYEEAITECKKAATREPNNLGAHLALTVSYGLSGRDEEARNAAVEVLKIEPKFSLESTSRSLVYKNQADKARFIDALRKAGLPDKPPLPLPDKPFIAVLPFVNMSDDKSQEYFSDGLTEEIITALSKTPKLFVIARNSTFTYKGKTVNVQQLSRELGVKYVLEGSVRRSGDQLRITAQLSLSITLLRTASSMAGLSGSSWTRAQMTMIT